MSTSTNLKVQSAGVALSTTTKSWIEDRTARQLGKFSDRVERVTLRFKDVNGPRGGKDMLCRAKVSLRGLPSVLIEKRAKTARKAFDLVAPSARRAVAKALEQAPRAIAAPRSAPTPRRVAAKSAAPARNPQGSLIGRRVGRADVNLERALDRPEKRRRDVPVDTARRGVSASDRKVGAESTATRNTKRNTRGMVASLEDSATGRPSRKSTRKSQNRAKAGSKLGRRETRRLKSPQARARRAIAKRT